MNRPDDGRDRGEAFRRASIARLADVALPLVDAYFAELPVRPVVRQRIEQAIEDLGRRRPGGNYSCSAGTPHRHEQKVVHTPRNRA